MKFGFFLHRCGEEGGVVQEIGGRGVAHDPFTGAAVQPAPEVDQPFKINTTEHDF